MHVFAATAAIAVTNRPLLTEVLACIYHSGNLSNESCKNDVSVMHTDVVKMHLHFIVIEVQSVTTCQQRPCSNIAEHMQMGCIDMTSNDSNLSTNTGERQCYCRVLREIEFPIEGKETPSVEWREKESEMERNVFIQIHVHKSNAQQFNT